jgi:S1-C subfamily serine protease
MPDNNSDNGLKISSVRPKSIAENAGLLKYDIIVEINGEAGNDIYGFMDKMQKIDKNQTVPFVILRNGEKQNIKISF